MPVSRAGAPAIDGPPDPTPPQPGPSTALARGTPDPEQCVRGGYCAFVAPRPIEAADLLFVVDNSGSMRQEQAALREQFPKLIRALTTGRKSNGETFPHLRDIHLGVVSTDMGLAGVANNFPGCNTQRHLSGGDDGLLRHPGNAAPGCKSEYPPFLSFVEGRDDAEAITQDFACISALGTMGCGFEQQLEAGLKALWPKHFTDAQGRIYAPDKNPLLFLSSTEEGRYGHGDTPPPAGNAGFARNPREVDSLLAIVVVSDEEDCSSRNTSHLISTNDPQNPLSRQGINLRCYYNQQNLFDLDRYVRGFQALRPNDEDNVIFAVVGGVPVDLVSAEARAGVDWTDEAARDAYFDRILDDPRMQQQPVNEDTPSIANLKPSCSRVDGYGERADAYPPRRMVEVAKRMGGNGIVQSLCQDDFTGVIDDLIELTASRVRPKCLPQQLERRASGKVACEMIWELPKGDTCETYPFATGASGRPRTNERGGQNCEIAQLAVAGDEVDGGDGFYYDDFSTERSAECREAGASRIAFSAGAQPPAGVRVVVDCSANMTP